MQGIVGRLNPFWSKGATSKTKLMGDQSRAKIKVHEKQKV